MGGMIRDDGINGAVFQPLHHGVHISLPPQGRIDLRGAVRQVHTVVGQRQMVGRYFRRDLDAAFLCLTHHVHRPRRADVCHMDAGVGVFRQQNIPIHRDILRHRWASLDAQHGTPMAFVHAAFLNQGGILVVIDDHLIEGAKIIEAIKENLRPLNVMTVIRKRHRPRFGHVP